MSLKFTLTRLVWVVYGCQYTPLNDNILILGEKFLFTGANININILLLLRDKDWRISGDIKDVKQS